MDEISIDWSKTNAPLHTKKIAEYYGIFDHLFGDSYFTPYIPLEINYDHNSINVPVYRGNIIKPHEVKRFKIFYVHFLYFNFVL